MDCPACKNEPMIVLELNDVEIDYCLNCKGIWLDAGELELLLGTNSKTEEFLNSFTLDTQTKEKKLKCPVCNKKMEKVLYSGNKAVRLDKCKANHGIWFDANELEEILKMGTLDNDNKVLQLFRDMFGKQ